MRILLDTNILIHREANRVINQDIGILFGWFDKLHYEKCIHPLSIHEIQKYKDTDVVKTIEAKIKNYSLLKTEAPDVDEITAIREKYDNSENDNIDTSLLKEVYLSRVSFLITEDRKIHEKARELGIPDLVFSIDGFLEKVGSENPELSDYKTLAVRKEYFGNIDVNEEFFDSFRSDYHGFNDWFNKKSDEEAYICSSEENETLAFLYIKIESTEENYNDLTPIFEKKKRLKIGTFKVISNGYKLGERFLKIIFDNALLNYVDEIYVTLFNETEEQERLIGLLEDWGFIKFGTKSTRTGDELVYVKDFHPTPSIDSPKLTYPFIDDSRRYFIVSIYPKYHTDLFPDSILNNESPKDFIESEPHRNAIQKVYISRSYFKDLNAGDIVVFYRTGGFYQGVVTTIGIVDKVDRDISSLDEFTKLCRKRSVFKDDELKEHWDYRPNNRPFVVNFLYTYSLPKRPNLKTLIELEVIKDISSVPRGFEEISSESFKKIIEVSETDESFIIH